MTYQELKKITEGQTLPLVGKNCDGENVIIRCYYGSSQYNTKQMSRLISNTVQDCQAVGINTMTPNEIAEMLSLWGSEPK